MFNRQNHGGKVASGLAILALATSATLVFTGCDRNQPVAQTSSSITAEAPKSGASDGGSGLEVVIPDTVQEVVPGMGYLEELPGCLAKVQTDSQTKLAGYQKAVVQSQGLKDTGVKAVFGHTVYTKGDSFVYVFSGAELVQSQAATDVGDPTDALFDAAKFDAVFGRDQGGVKLENGKLRAIEGSWVTTAPDESKVTSVMVDNQVVNGLLGSGAVKDGMLRLSAITGVGTVAEAQQVVSGGQATDMLVVKGTAYSMLGGIGNSIRVGFDGEGSFVILAEKMSQTKIMGVNEGSGEDQLELDVDGYLSVIKGAFCTELGIKADKYDFSLLTAKVATGSENMFDGATVLNPTTKATEKLDTIKADKDGVLYLDLDTLAKTSGVLVLYSADGTMVNLVTDPEWNATAGKGTEQGAVGAAGVSAEWARSTVEARQSENYVTVLREEAAATAEAQAQAEKEAAAKKAAEDAEKKAQAEKEAAAKEGGAQSQKPSGGQGAGSGEGYGPDDAIGGPGTGSDTGGGSGGSGTSIRDKYMGQSEPSGTKGNSMLDGSETWDSSIGGWVAPNGAIIYPNGTLNLGGM